MMADPWEMMMAENSEALKVGNLAIRKVVQTADR